MKVYLILELFQDSEHTMNVCRSNVNLTSVLRTLCQYVVSIHFHFTCGSGNSSDQYSRDGHEQAAKASCKGQEPGCAGVAASQHTLEVHLPRDACKHAKKLCLSWIEIQLNVLLFSILISTILTSKHKHQIAFNETNQLWKYNNNHQGL